MLHKDTFRCLNNAWFSYVQDVYGMLTCKLLGCLLCILHMSFIQTACKSCCTFVKC